MRDNDIENNNAGIVVESGLHNKIRSNSLAKNATLGIDLGDDGVTKNNDDSAFGALLLPNRDLDSPELSYAAGTNLNGEIDGTLKSTKSTYTIDVYASASCDNNGYGESALWLGSTKVSIDPILQIATAPFRLIFFLEQSTVPANAQITATATDADGNTSEFSACTPYLPDEIFKDGFNG